MTTLEEVVPITLEILRANEEIRFFLGRADISKHKKGGSVVKTTERPPEDIDVFCHILFDGIWIPNIEPYQLSELIRFDYYPVVSGLGNREKLRERGRELISLFLKNDGVFTYTTKEKDINRISRSGYDSKKVVDTYFLRGVEVTEEEHDWLIQMYNKHLYRPNCWHTRTKWANSLVFLPPIPMDEVLVVKFKSGVCYRGAPILFTLEKWSEEDILSVHLDSSLIWHVGGARVYHRFTHHKDDVVSILQEISSLKRVVDSIYIGTGISSYLSEEEFTDLIKQEICKLKEKESKIDSLVKTLLEE